MKNDTHVFWDRLDSFLSYFVLIVQISIIYILFKSIHIQYISYTFHFHLTFFILSPHNLIHTVIDTYSQIAPSLHIHSLYCIPAGLR